MDAGEGEVDRPYVGLHLLELDVDTALQMRRRNSKLPILAAGVLVTAVNKGSPADKAGLRAGDVITGWSSHLRISKEGILDMHFCFEPALQQPSAIDRGLGS